MPIACLLLLLLPSERADAGTITITSGTITMRPGLFSGGSVTLVGEPDFSITGWLSGQGAFSPTIACKPCTSGTPIPLFADFSGLDFGVTMLNGVKNPDVNGLNSPDSFELRFSGTPFLAPPVTMSGDAILTSPVMVTGRYAHGAFPGTVDTVVGSGVATLRLDHDGIGLWEGSEFSIDIGSNAVTPEPATLLMVASGIGLMVLRRARRRRSAV